MMNGKTCDPRIVACVAALVLHVVGARNVRAQAKVPARPPAPPSGITVAGIARAVTIAWTPAGPGLAYRVLRAESAAGAAVEIGSAGAAASFVDTTARAGVTWFYRVVVLRAGGRRDTSSVVAYTVPAASAPKRRPLSAPRNASGTSHNQPDETHR